MKKTIVSVLLILLFVNCGSAFQTKITYVSPQPYYKSTVSVKDFGAVGNGVADDTKSIQRAVNFVKNSGALFFPAGVYLLSSTITIQGKTNLRVYGNKAIILVKKSLQPFYFYQCAHLKIENINFQGHISPVQFELIHSPIKTINNKIDNDSNASARSLVLSEKIKILHYGTKMNVSLNKDKDDNFNQSVSGFKVKLDSSARYIVTIGSNFVHGYGITAPKFFLDHGKEYSPQTSDNWNYIKSQNFSASVNIGRFYHSTASADLPDYKGLNYDFGAISIYKLINQLGNLDFDRTAVYPFLRLNSVKTCVITNCKFNNFFRGIGIEPGCDSVNIINNSFKYLFSGCDVTKTSNVFISGNNFDLRFKDNFGKFQDQVVWRQKAIGGNVTGQSNIKIVNNIINGANWAIEFITNSATEYNSNILVEKNAINTAFVGISLNNSRRITLIDNTITSNNAYGVIGIELAGKCENVTVSGNKVLFTRTFGLANLGISVNGDNILISKNVIKALIPVCHPSYDLCKNVSVDDNLLSYGNCGIFARNTEVIIKNNRIVPYDRGYTCGVGYTPQSMCAFYVDFPNFDSHDYNIQITNNYLVSSLTYLGYCNAVNLNFKGNIIKLPYKTKFPIFGSMSKSVLSNINYVFSDNIFDESSNLNFTTFVNLDNFNAAKMNFIDRNNKTNNGSTRNININGLVKKTAQ